MHMALLLPVTVSTSRLTEGAHSTLEWVGVLRRVTSGVPPMLWWCESHLPGTAIQGVAEIGMRHYVGRNVGGVLNT